jgi:hypothetical protein
MSSYLKKDTLYTYTSIWTTKQANLIYIETEEVTKSLLDSEGTNSDEVETRVLEDLDLLGFSKNEEGVAVLIQNTGRFEMQKPIENNEGLGRFFIYNEDEKEVVEDILRRLKNIDIDIDEDDVFSSSAFVNMTYDIDNIDGLKTYLTPLMIDQSNREKVFEIIGATKIIFQPNTLCVNNSECDFDSSAPVLIKSSVIINNSKDVEF